MNSVGMRELKRDTSAVINRVRENRETIDVTLRGSVVARIVPVESIEERQARVQEVLERIDRLSEQITAEWQPNSMSAVDAVREQRRDL